MKVSASAFLQGKKPALKELLNKLLSEYEYASILGQDSVAKNYTVSAGGIGASQDNVLTKRGFIVRVMDKNGYGEYSFSDIDESAIDSICISIREGIDQLNSLPNGVSFMEKGIPADEAATLAAASEYELHPSKLGDNEIISRLTALREKGVATRRAYGGFLCCFLLSGNTQAVPFRKSRPDAGSALVKRCADGHGPQGGGNKNFLPRMQHAGRRGTDIQA